MSIGQRLLDVPFGEMITSLGLAIAEAQSSLDRGSMDILKVMGDSTASPVELPYPTLGENGGVIDKNITTSMIGAGFQPVFYQFAETIIEVKIAITTNYEREYTNKMKGERKETTYSSWSRYYGARRSSLRIRSTPIDATYSSKYNFTQEGSSTLRTRLVPVPPNSIIQQLIELRSQFLQQTFEVEIKKAELELAQKQEDVDKELEDLKEDA